MKLMKTMRKKSLKTVKIRLTPAVIYLYIPVIPQYRYTVYRSVLELTTVPVLLKPVTSYLRVL